jgi:apoptosis-inducing factor 2
MKKVVLIGGGFAGACIAKNLEKELEVTLIDSKNYFEFTPSILRTIVEPQHAKKIQVLHRHYLHKSNVVEGTVENITDTEVITETQSFPFDYLAICSGSKYSPPIKEQNLVIASRGLELMKYAEKLRKSRTVLIIGGGLVGTELAAEIVTHFPNKKITIVHSKSELIERSPKKARDYAKNFLTSRGVDIILNERVVRNNNNYKTHAGETLTADITFSCTGIMPNYKHLGVCSTELTTTNHLCVQDTLQVVGRTNIFAVGDITAIAEEKTAQNAEEQAKVVIGNIRHLTRQEPLEKYSPKTRTMVISLGKWNGILIHGNKVLPGIIPGILKRVVEWKTMMKYR